METGLMAGKTPIYQVVKDTLREKIDTGVLATGERIPSEEDLAVDFGCSRLTVHRALRELADEGMLIRRRRAGTQVAPRGVGGILIRVPRIRDEIEALQKDYRYEFLSRELKEPPAQIAKLLKVRKGNEALRVTCRHWADDRVFQYENRWINLSVASGALEADFSATSANEWLLSNVAYSGLDHEISARNAGSESAGNLKIPVGAAVVQIRRLTHQTTRRVTYSVLTHPGDLFSLRSESDGYALD